MARDRLAEIRARQAAGLPPASSEPLNRGWQAHSPIAPGQATPADFNPFSPAGDDGSDYMTRRGRDLGRDLPALPRPSVQAEAPFLSGVGDARDDPYMDRGAPSSQPLAMSRSTSAGHTSSSRRQTRRDIDNNDAIPAVPSRSPVQTSHPAISPLLSPTVAYLGTPPEAPLPRDFDPNEGGQDHGTPFESTYSPTVRSPARKQQPRQAPPDSHVSPVAPAPGSLAKGRHAHDAAPYSTQQRGYSAQKASTVELVETDGSDDQKPYASKMMGQVQGPHEVSHEEFYQEISDLQQALRETNGHILAIGDLHMRMLALPSTEDRRALELKEQLDERKTMTRTLFQQLRDRLHALEQSNVNLRASIRLGQSYHTLTLTDTDVREQQITGLKDRVKAAIQRYGETERDYRRAQRGRLERQVKVVNPGMTQDEISEAVKVAEESGSGAMFTQALQSNGARLHAARGVLRDVQDRAAELARIEATLIELAELFQDMSVMVEAQDAVIVDIEKNAVKTEMDTEQGLTHVQQAVVHARNYRKYRWWCFGFIVIILAVIAIVLCVELIPRGSSNSNNNQGNAAAPPTSAAATPAAPATLLAAPTVSTSTLAVAVNSTPAVSSTGLANSALRVVATSGTNATS